MFFIWERANKLSSVSWEEIFCLWTEDERNFNLTFDEFIFFWVPGIEELKFLRVFAVFDVS